MDESRPGRSMQIALALGAVYVIWGSTYLAIRFAIDTIPPFAMAGVRFTIAGWLLYGLLRLRGMSAPTWGHWLAAALVGTLLLGVGNGGVTWAEQSVPSGVAALILAGTPAWMVLLDWIRPGGSRPHRRVLIGVGLGLAGIVMLVFAAGELRVERVDPLGAVVVMGSSLAWATGSIVSRSLKVPSSAMQVTAMQMIVAGLVLSLVALASGEWSAIDLGSVSGSSALALLYLIVFGSWIGFSAYIWLLKTTTPAVASTYAYVNPAVAVFLGWALAGEAVDAWTVGAMAVIVAGVVLVTLRPGVSPADPDVASAASPGAAVMPPRRRPPWRRRPAPAGGG